MHKCSDCGQEYEGKFCPNCGAQWQEEKTCPQCGANLNGSAKFCNECGYSFAQEKPEEKRQPSGFKEKLNTVWTWIKSHLKIVIPVAVAVLLVIILSCSIPACVKAKNNGTYYKLNLKGEPEKETYFIIKSGKWEDEDGESGTYKKDGDKIIFYYTFMGETEELCSGTIKDGVLIVNDETFISEKHKHKYGEWETTRVATCTAEGMQTRTCACGVNETQKIEKIPHKYEWFYNEKEHWQICCVCESKTEETAHSNEDFCTVCGYYSFEYILNDDEAGYTVKGKELPYNNIIVPESYNGLPVTSIGDSAFENCCGLTSVTIPDNVTRIGSSAFYGCSNLSNIIIPNGVTTISDYAFANCSKLLSVTIGNKVETIGLNAFNSCSNLKGVYIDNINDWLNINFEISEITSDYQSNPLYYANNLYIKNELVTDLVIPYGTTIINQYSFYSCMSIKNLSLPSSIQEIGRSAFDSYLSMSGEYESKVHLNSVNYLGTVADWCNIMFDVDANPVAFAENFYINNEILTEIIIPESIQSIDIDAFRYCNSIETVYWNAINCRADGYPFTNSLKSIIFSDKVTYISTEILNSSALECITVDKGNETYSSQDGILYNKDKTKVIYVPQKLKGEVLILEGITSIESSAFKGRSDLTNIIIPNTVTSIGSSAFEGCTGLTNVNIPDGVTTIGSSAFKNCGALTNLTIPDSITSIGSSAFDGCTNLMYNEYNNAKYLGNDSNKYVLLIEILSTDINTFMVLGSTRVIYNYAFKNCVSLTSIIIPESVVYIGFSAFAGCSNLESMTLPFVGSSINDNNPFGYIFGARSYEGGVKTLQRFSGSDYDEYYIPSLLKSVKISGGKITYGAFENCSGLTSITMPSEITQISQNAFYNCAGLTNVIIPENVIVIGKSAFYGCDKLFNKYDNAYYLGTQENNYAFLISAINTSITACVINDNAKFICEYAFQNCSKLRTITIPKNITKIDNYAFRECGLTSIVVPATVVTMGYAVFYCCSSIKKIYCETESRPSGWISGWNLTYTSGKNPLPYYFAVTWGYKV